MILHRYCTKENSYLLLSARRFEIEFLFRIQNHTTKQHFRMFRTIIISQHLASQSNRYLYYRFSYLSSPTDFSLIAKKKLIAL